MEMENERTSEIYKSENEGKSVAHLREMLTEMRRPCWLLRDEVSGSQELLPYCLAGVPLAPYGRDQLHTRH